MNIKRCPMHCFSLPFLLLPFLSFSYSCSKRTFSEFNLNAAQINKSEFTQVGIPTVGTQLYYTVFYIYGGYSESVALASEVIFWEHTSRICLEFDVFQVCTVILSMACGLVFSPKIALQNCGTYSFLVKEATL